MENEHKDPEIYDQDWLDELLGIKKPDSQMHEHAYAMQSDELKQQEEGDLERIVQQTLENDWKDHFEGQAEQQSVLDMTQKFQSVDANSALQRRNRREDKKAVKQSDAKQSLFKSLGISNLIATLIWLVLVVTVGISLGRTAWLCAADLLAFGRESKEVTIVVSENDDISDVAKKLKDAGLIRYPKLFTMFAELTGKGKDIDVGSFTVNAIYDYNAMINAMINYGTPQDIVEIMFPEGYNCAQIFALLEEKGVCTAQELEQYAADGKLDDYWFLDGVKRGHKYCLEGYLAPDTYQFYTDDEPKRVLEKFLDEFDDRLTDHLKEEFIELNQYMSEKMRKNGYGSQYIAEHQLTLQDVVIIASIVEKETASNRESYKIASVFYNRLANMSSYPYLQSDATIDYAIDYYNKGQLITDKQINDSPFNTYTHKGLIPGPICNPGLNSLGAALSPENTDYYFFIYDSKAGEHRFSKTLREHENHRLELEKQG